MASSSIFSPTPRSTDHLQTPWSNPKVKPSKTQLHLFKTQSQNPLIYSNSFPHNLKLPSLKHPFLKTHSPDAINENFTKNLESLATLQRFPTGFESLSDSDKNPKRVYFQDPPWITSLLMKNFYKNSFGFKNRVRVEFDKRNYYILRRRQIKAETEAWEKMTGLKI